MLELRNPHGGHRLLASVSIGAGGLVRIFLIAAAFGIFGAKTGVPFAMAALLGGIGGTASLIIHELGHVRAARRADGIRSAAISLVWLGAATRFEGEYEDGGEQTRVAIGGPLA